MGKEATLISLFHLPDLAEVVVDPVEGEPAGVGGGGGGRELAVLPGWGESATTTKCSLYI